MVDLDDYKIEGCALRLHIGIGAGEIAGTCKRVESLSPCKGIHVGGTNNHYEFFISGQVLEQVSACEKQAGSGECYVSAFAWVLVENGRLSGTQKGK